MRLMFRNNFFVVILICCHHGMIRNGFTIDFLYMYPVPLNCSKSFICVIFSGSLLWSTCYQRCTLLVSLLLWLLWSTCYLYILKDCGQPSATLVYMKSSMDTTFRQLDQIIASTTCGGNYNLIQLLECSVVCTST